MPAMKGFLRSFSSSSRRSSTVPSLPLELPVTPIVSSPRNPSQDNTVLIYTSGPGVESEQDSHDDTPETLLLREMKAFCESNTTPHSQSQQGNEYVHLPRIVEIAESSPTAAREAAQRIRKYLSTPNSTPTHVQFNALMLMRILGDNPGHSFTINFDEKFCNVIKDQLRNGRDWYVRHYLCEYLAHLEATRYQDDDLQMLLQVWAKIKAKSPREFVQRYTVPPGTQVTNFSAQYQAGQPMRLPRPSRTLPNPDYSPAELDGNELIKEFIERCQSSARTLQRYIHSTNPAPDEDTLLTLIETNDEISVALSRQQRAMLKARKARGTSSPTPNPSSPISLGSDGMASGGLGGTSTFIPVGSASKGPTSELQSMPSISRCLEDQSSPRVELPAAVSASHSTARSRKAVQYEWNSADFEVQNPFADENAASDSDAERRHPQATAAASATSEGRVQAPLTEQKR
ncbi:hypothetical protein N7539_002534 [Penicillium diatomitis]|uniref:GAT domain-containing protein n=1 Tax=Penicillium diatomitis TaxID=2819901 RepID=A0A9W9XF13_9EURO|nr:uncharacterized protein N7539_002534 [Penicillium diatomitis]KAJ5490967.1 hypothetical protein N7539_002534 [Penicillium diatomitis]